jgi:FkbM family methyltransferase
MALLSTVFDKAVGSTIDILGINTANKIICRILQRVNPVAIAEYGECRLMFSCPNEMTRWRVETFATKEPETLEGIDTLRPGEVLFDIGANVGLYSVYAAAKELTVVAFEPEAQNFSLLNRNVFLNRLADRVCCLNVAITDKDALDFLYLPTFEPGAALHNYGAATNWKHEHFEHVHKQAVLAFSLDSFLEKYPEHFPSHIKIDVDGLEAKVVSGAQRTLRDPRMATVAIELNEELEADILIRSTLLSYGYQQRSRRQGEMMKHSQYRNVFNYVFSKHVPAQTALR